MPRPVRHLQFTAAGRVNRPAVRMSFRRAGARAHESPHMRLSGVRCMLVGRGRSVGPFAVTLCGAHGAFLQRPPFCEPRWGGGGETRECSVKDLLKDECIVGLQGSP